MNHLQQRETVAKTRSSTYDSFLDKLKELADHLRTHENINIQATSSRSFETRNKFYAYPAAQQNLIISNFNNYYDTCQELITSGHGLRDKMRNVLTHLKLHRLRIPTDSVLSITEGSCVELYDKNCVQTFRSPEFFQYTSHSLEDLVVLPYPELFDRSFERSKDCMVAVMQVLSGTAQMVPEFCPDHIVREINSEKKIISKSKGTLLSALMSETSDEVLGFLHVFEVRNQHQLTFVH